MKEARLTSHAAYIRSLPYYNYYEEFNGHPPLHPHIVHTLSLQIAEADYQLRRDLDSDWRSCVIRYPDVLAHYFSVVKVTLPQDPQPPPAGSALAAPPLGFIAPPPSRALSYVGSSAPKKGKEVRGKTPEPKASSSSVAGPVSGSRSASGSGSAAGAKKKAAEAPDAGDLGGALAKLLDAATVGATKAESKAGAASAASTSAARRGPLAGRGTPLPEAALRNYHKRRSMGSDYVLSGYAAHIPPPPMRAVADWRALSARFP
jgi:hypothetical protein